jgi:hypothetical protein
LQVSACWIAGMPTGQTARLMQSRNTTPAACAFAVGAGDAFDPPNYWGCHVPQRRLKSIDIASLSGYSAPEAPLGFFT